LRTLWRHRLSRACGIFELLELTDEVRPLVGAEADASLIDGAAIRSGMTTMLDDCCGKMPDRDDRGARSAARDIRALTDGYASLTTA